MATSTFERKIEIQDVESLKKLIDVMNADVPKKRLSQHPFSDAERERCDRLLKQCLSRSKR